MSLIRLTSFDGLWTALTEDKEKRLTRWYIVRAVALRVVTNIERSGFSSVLLNCPDSSNKKKLKRFFQYVLKRRLLHFAANFAANIRHLFNKEKKKTVFCSARQEKKRVWRCSSRAHARRFFATLLHLLHYNLSFNRLNNVAAQFCYILLHPATSSMPSDTLLTGVGREVFGKIPPPKSNNTPPQVYSWTIPTPEAKACRRKIGHTLLLLYGLAVKFSE